MVFKKYIFSTDNKFCSPSTARPATLSTDRVFSATKLMDDEAHPSAATSQAQLGLVDHNLRNLRACLALALSLIANTETHTNWQSARDRVTTNRHFCRLPGRSGSGRRVRHEAHARHAAQNH